MRPRLLDLFAGCGGSAYGYALAGFEVTAVDDIERPDRAPGVEWVTADALTFPLRGFDVVTASPPCTDRTTLRNAAESVRGGPTGTGWMLTATLARLRRWGRRTGGLWIVENVVGARADMPDPITLCGSMFELEIDGYALRRHRLFSSNLALTPPGPCRHGAPVIGVYGDLRASARVCSGRRPAVVRPHGDMRASITQAREVMCMPWAGPVGLSLAVPPAYTHHLGRQLYAELRRRTLTDRAEVLR